MTVEERAMERRHRERERARRKEDWEALKSMGWLMLGAVLLALNFRAALYVLEQVAWA